jgi:uncharacterized protein YggU (UPF0235/DUF167 family)
MNTKMRLPIWTTLRVQQAKLKHNANEALGLPQSEIRIKRGTRSRSKHIAVTTPDPLKVYTAIEALEVAS